MPFWELDLEVEGRFWDMRGSSVGVSEYVSDWGLSLSGEKGLWGAASGALAFGGKDGKDLCMSIVLLGCCVC